MVSEDSEWRIAAVHRLGYSELRRLRTIHHMDMDRNLYLARKVDSDVTRDISESGRKL